MNCLICDGEMSFYFTKTFDSFNLGNVEYWKCGDCGFCASKTHFEMTGAEWSLLNQEFHSMQHSRVDNPYNRNKRYFDQSLMIFLMIKNNMINKNKMLDWGSGNGNVSKLLDEQFDITLLNYDKYFTPFLNVINESELKPRAFDMVLNTGVFEHVRDRKTLDEIEQYVKADKKACLAIHTLIPETIPKDSNWMYLLPVHSAFHTNKSMQILMEQWGYTCSVYNPDAKLWVLFRENPNLIEEKVVKLNTIVGYEYLSFKKGFMDYWKSEK